MSSMRLNVYYKGNDPNDCRSEGSYENVKSMHYDDNGNLTIVTEKETKQICRTFVDDITVEINK